MKTVKLSALKPHRYGTRHLEAGDEYEAPMREGVAMVASRKAKFVKQRKQAEAPPAPAATKPATVIDGLRAQAGELGVDVDRRWGPARLQDEIAQAKAARE